MIFWISVLIGLIVAYLYTRKGLYEAAILLFNLAISIYLALFLMPTFLEIAPSAVDFPGGLILTTLVLFAICFGTLFGISFIIFTGRLCVPLAKGLNWLGGGLFGFFSGFLCISFMLTLTTIERIPGLPELIQARDMTANTKIICSTCNKLHFWIGSNRLQNTEKLLAWLNTQTIATTHTFDPNSDPNASDPNTSPQE